MINSIYGRLCFLVVLASLLPITCSVNVFADSAITHVIDDCKKSSLKLNPLSILPFELSISTFSYFLLFVDILMCSLKPVPQTQKCLGKGANMKYQRLHFVLEKRCISFNIEESIKKRLIHLVKCICALFLKKTANLAAESFDLA